MYMCSRLLEPNKSEGMALSLPVERQKIHVVEKTTTMYLVIEAFIQETIVSSFETNTVLDYRLLHFYFSQRNCAY